MNSLEFINKETESLQTEIEHLKNAIRLKPVYADTVYECERGKECLARLNVLEQIKSELEAWYICKNDVVILQVLKDFAEGKCINWHGFNKEQQKIMQIALEIKD